MKDDPQLSGLWQRIDRPPRGGYVFQWHAEKLSQVCLLSRGWSREPLACPLRDSHSESLRVPARGSNLGSSVRVGLQVGGLVLLRHWYRLACSALLSSCSPLLSSYSSLLSSPSCPTHVGIIPSGRHAHTRIWLTTSHTRSLNAATAPGYCGPLVRKIEMG